MNTNIAAKFGDSFKKTGFDFFTCVPCGILAPLLKELEKDSTENKFLYVPREDTALGLACGAWFAGRHPLILMQNSGFGHSINSIASLIKPFRIPITFIISMRGHLGKDSEENLVMEKITEPILELLEIPSEVVNENNFESLTAWAFELNTRNESPAALLITPELFGWSTQE